MYFNLTNYGFLVVPLLGYGSYSRILNPLDDPERLHSLCSNTLVRSAYVLRITMPIELCITYPEMLVFAHTRLAIVSRPLMPCWELTCIDFLYDAHLHLTFLFDRFKCLRLFANLRFSSIIQRSFMLETKYSSCPWFVSVFASHQHWFCVVKTCGHCVHIKHNKKKS